jgi:hypothetical protein
MADNVLNTEINTEMKRAYLEMPCRDCGPGLA